MRRAGALILCLATCTPRPGFDELLSQISDEIRTGSLPVAEQNISAADRSADERSHPDRAWRLRLLKAELCIAKGQFDAAARLIDTPIPEIPGRGKLEARRELQLAYIAIYTRNYKRAGEILTNLSKSPGTNDPEFRVEVDVANGVLASFTQPLLVADQFLSDTYNRAAALKLPYFEAA